MKVSDWVDDAREILAPSVVDQVNWLAEEFTPGDLTLRCEEDVTSIVAGTVVTFGLNTAYVRQVNPTNKELVIEPGWAGSPVVACETRTLVRTRPLVYTHRIFNAINAVLSELTSPLVGIFGVDELDIDFTPTQTVYDMAGADGVSRILSVRFGDVTDPLDMWPEVPWDGWKHQQSSPSTSFPSGNSLTLSYSIPTGSTVKVLYARDLVPADSLEMDCEITLLPQSAYDIPGLGAAARLATSGEWRRSMLSGQPDTRRSDEVPTGALATGARMLQARYSQRVEQEAARFISAYGYRSS